MTVGELKQKLNSFNDNDKVMWSAHYSLLAYDVVDIVPNLKGETMLVISTEDGFPDKLDLREMAQQILDTQELKWYEKKLLEEITNEL